MQPAQGFKPGVQHQHLADGRIGEGADAVRWFAELVPGVASAWVTLRCGTPGAAGSWTWSGELPGASPATIRLKVEALAVEEAARLARKVARKQALPSLDSE